MSGKRAMISFIFILFREGMNHSHSPPLFLVLTLCLVPSLSALLLPLLVLATPTGPRTGGPWSSGPGVPSRLEIPSLVLRPALNYLRSEEHTSELQSLAY